MNRALFALVLLAGCGGPSAPTAPPTPPPPVYPNMVGGWGGTQSDTWVAAGNITGSRVCNETWLITAQDHGSFSGAFQRTPGSLADCAVSGTIRGTVLPSGDIELGHYDSGTSSACTLVSGDALSHGVLSAAGNITAGTIIVLRCPFQNGTIDYRFTTSVVLTRR